MKRSSELNHDPAIEALVSGPVGIQVSWSKLVGTKLLIRGDVANGKPFLPISGDVLSPAFRVQRAMESEEAWSNARDADEPAITNKEFRQGFELLAMQLPQLHEPGNESTGVPGTDLVDAAKALVSAFADTFAYDEGTTTFRLYTGTHWQAENPKSRHLDPLVTEAIREIGQSVTSTAKVDGVLRFASSYCARRFDPPAGLVNFNNGTLDTATMVLGGHDRTHDLTYCLPYPYAPGEHPMIDTFLKETMPDPAAVRTFMAHIGLALLEDTRFHRAVLLIGPPRSGKSTALKLANRTVGNRPGGASAILFDRELEGMRSRFTWNGKRLVTIEELPVEALRNEETVKQMIAHDGVSMRAMFEAEIMENQWLSKLIFATNEKPRFPDRTGALSQRIIPISCPNGRLEPSGDESADQTATQDLFLKERLEPEVSAFAVSCIREALDALRVGRYPVSDAMRKLRDDIEERGDALKAWAADNCVLDASAWTATADLHQAFCTHCKESGHQPLALERFTSALGERFPTLTPKRERIWTTVGEEQVRKLVRGLKGIRFRKEDDPDPCNEDDPDLSGDEETQEPAESVTPPAVSGCHTPDDQPAPAAENGPPVTPQDQLVTPEIHLETDRCHNPLPEENGSSVTPVTPDFPFLCEEEKRGEEKNVISNNRAGGVTGVTGGMARGDPQNQPYPDAFRHVRAGAGVGAYSWGKGGAP